MTTHPFASTPRLKPAPGLVIGGKVRLDNLLGKGGMGAVWRGTHLTLNTPVAIKFMAESTPEALTRFQREAQVAAHIRSSNVVAIHDFGVEHGLPYIVMELLDGEDLGARLKRMSRLSLLETAHILLPVARGLERAHQARLVHRDLKPENIFLVREGDEDVPKILDFGIAKNLVASPNSLNVTSEGAVMGTPYYMSPEQSRARPDVDHRSDLWALGVILFRTITGKRPFDGLTAASLAVQICTEPVPKVGAVAPDLPPQLDMFFERALAKDPAHRFQSAREMAQAFAEIVGYSTPLGRTPLPSLSGTPSGGLAMSHSLVATGNATPLPVATQSSSTPHRRTIAVVALATLLLGGIGLFLLLSRASTQSSPAESGLAKSAVAAAVSPVPSPVPTPSASVAPEPTAEAAPDEFEVVPTQTSEKPTVKTVKPATSTKKHSRDLGY